MYMYILCKLKMTSAIIPGICKFAYLAYISAPVRCNSCVTTVPCGDI